jgi:hypothetical protein
MSIDCSIGLSHYSIFLLFTVLPIDTLQHFNILLFLDVNIINSGLSKIVKGEFSSLVLSVLPFIHVFLKYHLMVAEIIYQNVSHTHARARAHTHAHSHAHTHAHIRNKWMLEHICCYISLITTEDFNLINTVGWLYSMLVQEDVILFLSSS